MVFSRFLILLVKNQKKPRENHKNKVSNCVSLCWGMKISVSKTWGTQEVFQTAPLQFQFPHTFFHTRMLTLQYHKRPPYSTHVSAPAPLPLLFVSFRNHEAQARTVLYLAGLREENGKQHYDGEHSSSYDNYIERLNSNNNILSLLPPPHQ